MGDEYNVSAVFEAIDNITKPTSLMEKALDGFGGTMRRVWEFAAGSLVARGIETIVSGIRSIGAQALEAVGHAQNMEMGLEGLLTENLMYERVIKTQEQAIELTAEEKQKIADLTASRDIYTARLNEMLAKTAEAGETTELETAQMAQLENQIQKAEDAIKALNDKQGQLSSTTEVSWQNVREFGEANTMAKEQVQDLLGFVEKLAITSPFETSQVEEVTRIGLAAQMSTDQVKDFTKAFLDYSAVHGITSTNLAFAADQFLQLKKIGKLTTVDLRQLRNLGIDVARVLGTEMGMSVEEFNAQVEKNPALMDDLFTAFNKMAGAGTAGAAAKMAGTMSGLMSTLNDIFEVGGKKLLRPVVEAVTPMLAEMLGPVSEFVTGGQLEAFGQKAADAVLKVIGVGKQMFAAFKTGGVEGVLGVLFPPQVVGKVMNGFAQIISVVKFYAQVYSAAFKVVGGAVLYAWDKFIVVKDWIVANWPAIQSVITTVATTVWAAVSEKAQQIWAVVSEKFGLVRDWVIANWPMIRDTVTETVTAAWAIVSEKAQQIWAVVSEKFGLVRDWVVANWPMIKEKTAEAWDKIQATFQTVSDFVTANIIPVFDTLKIAINEFKLRLEAGQSPLEAFKKVLANWLPPEVSEPIINFLTTVETTGTRLWDWIKNTAIPTLQSWGDAFDKGFNPNLEKMNKAWEKFKTDIGPAVQNLLTGLKDVFAALFGDFKTTNEEAESFFTVLGKIAGFIVENGFIGILGLIIGAVNALGDAFSFLAEVLSGEWWSNFVDNMNLPPWMEDLFKAMGGGTQGGAQWVQGLYQNEQGGGSGSNTVEPRIHNQNTVNVNGPGLGGVLDGAMGQVVP